MNRQNGESCDVTSWDAVFPTTHFRCWTSRERPEKVLRVEQQWKNGTQTIVESVTSEYGENRGDEIPFPRRIVFVQEFEGKVALHEATDLSVLKINEPIPQKIFSIDGIPGVKAGTFVQWVSDDPAPAKGDLVWDGQGIVSRGPLLLEGEVGNKNADNGFGRALIYINIAFLCIICGLLGIRQWRQKS